MLLFISIVLNSLCNTGNSVDLQLRLLTSSAFNVN